jgi:hypothetical protein
LHHNLAKIKVHTLYEGALALESVFLSYSFSKPEDRLIAAELEDVFRSFGVRTVTGLNLGGNQLTDEVKALIKESDGLVALASRREQLASGDWITHPWIRDEFGYAKSVGKNAIALVEDGVSTNGAYESYERIPFERNNLAPALLKLSKTLGIWKDKAGKRIKVRLLPDELFENMQSPSFQYQFISRGIYLHLQGVRDDYLIEVQVSSPSGVLRSRATAQTMPITVE